MTKKLRVAQVRKLWTDALESGKYKQTTGMLGKKASNGRKSYCCLGVLCEVAVEHGVISPAQIGQVTDDNGMKIGALYYGRRSYSVPPSAVQKWVGMKDSSGSFKEEVQGLGILSTSLVNKNDYDECSFKQIAEIIKSEPKGLFGRPEMID